MALLKFAPRSADTLSMRRDRTLEKILKAFSDAVAEGDFDAAEGWFATARLHLGLPVEAPMPQPRPA